MSLASLRQPLTLRRILFSLLVAGIVAVLVGGALGFAAASDGQAKTAAPSDSSEPYFFGVPEPRLGDVFVHTTGYESRGATEGSPGHGHKASSSGVATFTERGTWTGVEPILSPAGESRASLVHERQFEIRIGGETHTSTLETLFDAATRQSLASRSEGTAEYDFDGSPSYLPTYSFEGSGKNAYRGTTWHTEEFGLRSCLLFNELQGRTLDVAQDIVLFRDCYLPGDRETTLGDRVFRAVGQGTVGDRSAVIFAEVADSQVADDARQVWLSADVPYPVHLLASYEDETGYASTSTTTLTEYVAGSQPLPYEGDAGPDLPALETRPLTPWTLDDAGVAHPFPLSAAYASARDDAEFSAVRDFLADHPAARVVQADFQEQSSNNGDRGYAWSWRIQDGADELTICSSETHRSGPDVAPWPLPAERPAVVTVDHQNCQYGGTGHAQEPIDLPAELPAVASLFERWRRVAGSEYEAQAPNSYGLSFACIHPHTLEGGCVPTVLIEVGYMHVRVDQGSLGVYVPVVDDDIRFEVRASQLNVWTDGGLFSLGEYASVTEMDFTGGGPTGQLPAAAHEQPPIEAQTQRTTSSSLWELPAGTYAAGTGAAALFAGLLYWLWPALKGVVALPFYSRVEKPRALEHAARAEIHALVQASPGIHTEEIVRRTGRGRGDVQHHLHKLMSVGLLAEVRAAGFTCYHVPGQVDQRVAAALPALKSDGARAVLAAIAAQPGSSGTRLATTTGLTRQAVHLHVHRLAEAGLVTTERAGREVRIQATALAAQVPAEA